LIIGLTMKYIVIKKGTLTHKIGDIIDLTDKQALSLVNKVKPAPVEPVKEPKKAKKGKA